jgi:hypothetical protein
VTRSVPNLLAHPKDCDNFNSAFPPTPGAGQPKETFFLIIRKKQKTASVSLRAQKRNPPLQRNVKGSLRRLRLGLIPSSRAPPPLTFPSASDVGQPRGAATGVDASPSLDEHFLLPVAKNIRLWRWIQLVAKKTCSFF